MADPDVSTGLLLLDVDGPLNPYAAKPTRRPRGYRGYRLTDSGDWYAGREARRHKGLRVWLHPDHGARLQELASKTGLELVWATTWMDRANAHIGPAVGLPELPVIRFPAADRDPDSWRADGGWKWPAIGAYAAGRPLAWLDDEHATEHFADARAEFDRQRTDVPTLLCHVDPAHGLLTEHFAQVVDWAQDLKSYPHT